MKEQLTRYNNYYVEKKEEEIINAFSLYMNQRDKTVKKNGQLLELTKTEYLIMELLMSSQGRIFTKQQIFSYAWEEEFAVDDNTVMVHISNLRSKIEDQPKSPHLLKTIKGLGYKFEKEE